MKGLLAALLLGLATPAFAATALDNQAVVDMVKLGLGSEIIGAKIEASPNHFDTSPQALAKLKKAGVPSSLISKMIAATATNTSAASTSGVAASHNSSFEIIDASGQRTSISPVRVTAELSYRKAWIPFHVGGPETFMFIDGRHAPQHTGSKPRFITNMDPLSVRLIHLGEKKDREARFVVFSGSTTDREVQLTSKDLGNGEYSLEPKAPLQAGEEYAFLAMSEMPAGYGFWAYFAQNAAAARAYDFGVN